MNKQETYKFLNDNGIVYGERGIWERPATMWNETIERDGKTYKRFEYIGE